jgi:peptidoglycan/LPS O-acetylase OafA/YrhL
MALDRINNLKVPFSEVTSVPELLQTSYIPSLDGLRAISIILVIISHITKYFPTIDFFGFDLGGFGVSIFFVISGFLITTLLLKEKVKHGEISLKNFYIRRVIRILPVAYLFLLCVVILNYAFSMNLPAITFVKPMLFVENYGDHTKFTPTGHFWSLSVEEHFYLIFPFILSKSLKNYLITTFVLILITPISILLFFHYKSHIFLINWIIEVFKVELGHGIVAIMVGSLLAIFLFKFPRIKLPEFKYPDVWLLAILLLSFLFHNYQLPFIGVIISPIFTSLLVLSVIYYRKCLIFNFLNLKPIIYIGTLSYSLYIWQQIFVYDQPWGHSFRYGHSLILNIVLLVITAMISYHLYEKPILKLKERFK